MADLSADNFVCHCNPRCSPGPCRRQTGTKSHVSNKSGSSYSYNYYDERKRPIALKERYERSRSEDNIIENRMNWFALIQGLLWATLGLFLQAQTESRHRFGSSREADKIYPWIYPLIDLISLFGILSSFWTLRSIRMLREQSYRSHEAGYNIGWKMFEDPSYMKQFSGTTFLLPLAIATAWVVVLLFNSGAF